MTKELDRKIIISDTITAKMAGEVIKRIQDINAHDDKEEAEHEAQRSELSSEIKKADKHMTKEYAYTLAGEILSSYERKPILITINSFGGSIYDGLAIIGAMENSETPIHTLALGSCMSMALPIFVTGDVRFAHRLTTFMYHDSWSGQFGTTEQMQRHVDELKRLNATLEEYLLENTLLTQDQLNAVKGRVENWYFNAKQAEEFGVADCVIPKMLSLEEVEALADQFIENSTLDTDTN